jgi:hypothetical protein
LGLPLTITTADLKTALQAFQAFVDGIPKTASMVALHDSDADGVTAGDQQLSLESNSQHLMAGVAALSVY